MEEELVRIKFSEIADALKDIDHPFPARLLRCFSDLSPRDLREFTGLWQEIPLARKQSLLEDLEDITENDTLVCFDEVAKAVLNDEDPTVRVTAIRLLWESDDYKIVPAIIELMDSDPDEGVRATAASLLGRFVYLGELDEIPDSYKISAVNHLLEVVNSDDLPQVRMRALESLGYSSSAKISDLIKKAYESSENRWVATSLCAMGRSADEQWSDFVQEKLDSGDSEVLFEAVRAAGELEISAALDQLFTLVEEQDFDSDVRLAAIWSLSQIGGPEVKEKLRELQEDAQSDEEMEWIEKALENIDLNSGPEGMNFFDFKPDGSAEDDFDDYSDDEEDEDFEDNEFASLDDMDDDDEEEE